MQVTNAEGWVDVELALPDVCDGINTMINDTYSFGEMRLDSSNEDELVPLQVKLPRSCKNYYLQA